MKGKLSVALILSALQLFSLSAFGQGSLTPPGPPGPTMLSLSDLGAKADQANSKLDTALGKLEKRTPISSAPLTISQPGSYYLTNNLSVSSGDAITINVSNVTLDLNGFTISSSAQSATGTAINVSDTQKNITIRNGFITGSVVNVGQNNYAGGGFSDGIICYAVGSAVSRISVSGMLHYGIVVAGLAEFCSVRSAGFDGIDADNVRHCSVADTGQTAISAVTVSDSEGYTTGVHGVQGNTVMNCNGDSSGGGAGIYAESATNCRGTSTLGAGIQAFSIESCRGLSNSSVGIFVRGGGSARNSSAEASSGTGFVVDDRAAARGCTVETSSIGFSIRSSCEITGNTASNCFTPFRVVGSGNRLDGNNGTAAAGNGAFDIRGSNNLIIRNSARANGNNQYPISGSNNTIGVVIDFHATGQTISNHEAWANFVY